MSTQRAKLMLVVAMAPLVILGVWSLRPGLPTGDSASLVFGEADLEGVVPAAPDEDAPAGGSPADRKEIEAPVLAANLVSRTTVRIRGRVVDRSGLPVKGAIVRLALRPLGPGGTVSQVFRVRQPDLTAADGRFAFAGPIQHPVGITLEVHGPGHAPRISEHDCPSTSDTLELGDLRLLAGGVVAGLVLDASERALPGATVSLHPGSTNPLAQSPGRAEVLSPVTTDASGSYRFSGLMPGAYRVRATAPDMQNGGTATLHVVDGEVRNETIRLTAGVELSGIVLGPGDAPVEGAVVRARNERATTGKDGRFRLEHLPPEPLQVDVRAPGYLTWQRRGVNPGVELEVRLGSGLRVVGSVMDAASGKAVERFAARIRRTRSLQEPDLGGLAEQLRRRIEAVRSPPAGPEAPETRDRREAVAAELQARMPVLEGYAVQHARVPTDIGPVEPRTDGKFAFDGLDEGVYVVEVLSQDHRFVRSAPIELRQGAECETVRIAVTRALAVRGVVVAGTAAAPVAGALVDLVRVRDDVPGRSDQTLRSMAPRGDPVMTVRSDASGGFELRHAPAGRYFVTARHPGYAAGSSDAFDLRAERDDLRVTLAATANVRGRVLGLPAGREDEARVLAIGASATVRAARVAADGTYRLESLEPGEYMLRAFLGEAPETLEDQMTAIFAAGAGALSRDVTLAEGASSVFDVRLVLPATGVVRGNLTLHGAPAAGWRVDLWSPDVARPLTAVPDARGEFTINGVPAGAWTLRVTLSAAGSRHELHREAITVRADAVTQVQAELRSGGLRGQVVVDDGTAPGQIEGSILVLPGAAAAATDVREHARSSRVHEVRVRGGAFRADVLTAGPARLVVQIRGRQPVESSIEIEVGAVRELTLRAGAPVR